jgi:hypothetical protein
MRHGHTLLGPDQSARGLAQSKTLARMSMACVSAKRLGLRWPSTAFPPRRVFPHIFQEKNRSIIYGNALKSVCGRIQIGLKKNGLSRTVCSRIT